MGKYNAGLIQSIHTYFSENPGIVVETPDLWQQI